MGEPYVYILVRTDLAPAHRAVQAAHALWEVCKWNKLDQHPSLVICGVTDEDRLLIESRRLHTVGLTVTEFREPDLNFSLTAIALIANGKSERKHFKKYDLLL
jgi:hypothetical protein